MLYDLATFAFVSAGSALVSLAAGLDAAAKKSTGCINRASIGHQYN